MKKLQPHPLSQKLPEMAPGDYLALKADIANHGQRDPIILLEGKILDGRHRYRACCELGINCKEQKFNLAWGSPVAYVYSKALHRNWNDSQKACAAVELEAEFAKLAKERQLAGVKCNDPMKGKAAEQAGELFNVSSRYVQLAKTLRQNDSDLFQQCFKGDLVLTRASRLYQRAHRTAQANAAAHSGRLIHPEECSIIVGDTLREMRKLPRQKFRLIFNDPPYNLGFKYDSDPTKDLLPTKKYLQLTRDWIKECAELLTPDGTLCWMIPEEWVHYVGVIIEEVGLHIRRLIVWHESFGQAGQNNFGRTCRFIWYAVKDPDRFVFDAGSILVESKRSSVYADKRAMPDGKVPDALWDFSRLCGTFSERVPDEGIPTQLPIELVKRAVRCFTEVGDSVLDSFGGTGTTARAALSCGRKCVTIERSKYYAKIIKRELLRMSADKEK